MDGNISVISAICLSGLAFVLGVMKDIIMAFLKGEKRQEPSMKEEHPIRKECLVHETRMVLLEQRVGQQDIELKNGRANFDKFEQSISNMEKSLAVLVDRSNSRRSSDD